MKQTWEYCTEYDILRETVADIHNCSVWVDGSERSGNEKPFSIAVVHVSPPPEGRHLKRLTGGVGWVLHNVWLLWEIVFDSRQGWLGIFAGAAFMTLYAAELFPFKRECWRSELFYSDTATINRCLSCTCHQRLVFLKHLGKCGQRYYCAFLTGHFVFCIHEKFEINVLIVVHCGISFDKFHDWQLLVPTSWTTTVLDKMRLVGVELVVGLFNMNLLCANYRVADTNHLFSLISPFISTPSLYLSCSQSARLPSQVCRPSPFGLCQPWNVTRTLKTTAAQPTQTQMFSLVVRLNIQEGGTKNRFNRKCWVYEDSLSPRLPWAVSDYASIMLYTPTGDFIRYTCSTQTSYQLITWQQFDLFKAHGYGQENLLRDQKCHLDDLQPADDLDLYLAMMFVQDILMTTFKLRHGWP